MLPQVSLDGREQRRQVLEATESSCGRKQQQKAVGCLAAVAAAAPGGGARRQGRPRLAAWQPLRLLCRAAASGTSGARRQGWPRLAGWQPLWPLRLLQVRQGGGRGLAVPGASESRPWSPIKWRCPSSPIKWRGSSCWEILRGRYWGAWVGVWHCGAIDRLVTDLQPL